MAYAELKSDSGPPSSVDPNEPRKKRVVVLGTGWAGTSFLKDLDASIYDVQVISPRNYFAFTPLLPSVTCGTVEARSIVEPVRNIIKKVEEMEQNKKFKNKLFLDATLFDNIGQICTCTVMKISRNYTTYSFDSLRFEAVFTTL